MAIESAGNFGDQRDQCGCCGVERFVDLLCRISWKDACEKREDEALQDIVCWEQKIIRQFNLLSFGFLIGFRMETMMARFQMAGVVAVLKKLLKILQRSVMPARLRCLRWTIVF